MKGTLEMMKGNILGKEKELDEVELIQNYQKSFGSNILAYVFVQNFGAILKISNCFKKLNESDKASFCLQELDKALRTYNFDKNTKFVSYFLVLFKNRLMAEENMLNMQKRRIMNEIESTDDLLYEESYALDDYFATDEEIIANYNLDDREAKECNLIVKGYSMKEISKSLHMSLDWCYKKRGVIKEKILNSI